MNTVFKNKFVILGIVAVILVIAIFIGRNNKPSDKTTPSDETSLAAEKDEVLVTGTIECLKIQNGSAQNEANCVKGIKGDDGKTYAINTTNIGMVEWNIDVGTKVTAVGVYQPANTSTEEGSAFQYDGVLVVRKIQ